jgi:Zn-dependent protease
VASEYLDFAGFALIVMGLLALIWLPLNWRRGITVTRRVTIDAPADTVWKAIDLRPGPVVWSPHLRRITCEDGDPDKVTMHHEMVSPQGNVTAWDIEMDVETRRPGKSFTARRRGLDAFETLDDCLLAISARVEHKDQASRLIYQEIFGPKSLAGRFMAYSDISRAMSQLKSFCETGEVCKHSARKAGAALSIASAIATVCAFALLLGWPMAIAFAVVLIVHELGHLVSFRMIGQPWGRIMFVPFIGGVAVSRVPHKRLADDVFCALMGAGLSLVLLLPAGILFLFGASIDDTGGSLARTVALCAALAGAINLLNLLPIFPLDGGHVVRAMLQSVAPTRVRHYMYIIAAMLGAIGLYWQNPLLTAIALITFFQSKRLGPPAAHLETMNMRAIAILGGAYVVISIAHATAFTNFGRALFG